MQGKRLMVGAALALALLAPPAALGARHVYVSNEQPAGPPNVAAFTVASNGVLQQDGPAAASGNSFAEGVVAAPDARHLYVASQSNPASVATLPIAADGTVGAGTAVPAGGNSAFFLAIAPDGRHVYVETASGLSVLAAAPDGSLSPQASGIPAGLSPAGVAVTPGGGFLYVADFNGGGAGRINRFSIGSDGGLTPQGAPTPTGGMAADQITITPNGQFLYVTDSNSFDVSGFSINPATGALTPIPGGPVAVSNADFPGAIATTPDGARIYVASGERAITGFDVNPSSGTLTPVPGSPVTVGTGPSSNAALAVSPGGGHLLETLNLSSTLTSWAMAADGSISQASSVPSGAQNPDSQAVQPAPNQPPTAAFTVKSLRSGRVHFNGTTSKDSDGKVSNYRWDFGDGTAPTDVTKAGTDHTYALAGKYTAKLVTIDNEGCATSLVFTGQSALCNGSGAAAVSHNLRSSVQFSLAARRRQRSRVLRATGVCPTEACKVQLGGSVKVGNRKLKLRRSRRSLAAGTPRTWRIRLPHKARKALKAGRTLTVRISAGARAASGQGRNTSRRSTVKLRLRRRRS